MQSLAIELAACLSVYCDCIGLSVTEISVSVFEVLGEYPGDALWAIGVYLGLALLKPKIAISRLALYALIVSYLDEFSQLIQLPGHNHVRQTTVGHLILSTVFSWYDLLAYTVGIAIAIILDSQITLKRKISNNK